MQLCSLPLDQGLWSLAGWLNIAGSFRFRLERVNTPNALQYGIAASFQLFQFSGFQVLGPSLSLAMSSSQVLDSRALLSDGGVLASPGEMAARGVERPATA